MSTGKSGRPRQPKLKAEITGAAAKDPGRYKDRKPSKKVRPVGQPYKSMSEAECKAWADFVETLPWLNSSHRKVLRLTCKLESDLYSRDEPPVAMYNAYATRLGQLGATPTDEGRINLTEEDAEAPADRFFTTH